MNPRESEFDASDPMMEELRAIRDSIGEKNSKMSTEEAVRWYREQAEKAASSIGCVLVPHPTIPNARMMVPKETLEANP